MRRYLILIQIFFLLSCKFSFTQDLTLFDRSGKVITEEIIINGILSADVVFFGELHSQKECQELQFSVLKALHVKYMNNLVLAAEMFETDNQLILDEFLQNKISEKTFEDEMRLWKNYTASYKQFVTIAKLHNLKFIATNVPRRYALMVSNKGFRALDGLSAEACSFMAPLPVIYDSTLNCYKNILNYIGIKTPVKVSSELSFIPQAQALKDATMAWFIYKNIKKDQVILHFNGTYHSNFDESIIWYLKKYGANVNIKTISTVAQTDMSKLDEQNVGIADFVICLKETNNLQNK